MRRLLLLASFMLSMLSAFAQPKYGNLPPIHVDGNQLRDEAGNKVVLHGIMDTPSPWFNNNRWGAANDANVTACVTYFNRLFVAETDNSQGAYCNLFRLHLDPCWTNDNSVNAKGFTSKNGKIYDPLGNEVSGEADIHHFSKAKLKKYMKSVYTRIAIQALKNGMYVIMRPPGVCPGDIQVGTYYQDYLTDVWDIVTQNDTILKYYGHISIELANEPVRIRNANGQESGDERFHDFFQPVVDKIRANGFKGIIWVPGGIWQQEYRPYASHPITDPLNNIGYAIHDYPGWYGLSDGSYNVQTGINKFAESLPIIRTNPIVITEIDWSPQKPGTGHYNESGIWVESNYGTWATASTSKWGKAFKQVKEHYGNVSMTLSGSHCYFDWDTYKNSNYKKVVPAFPGIKEACGEACFEWYAEWAKVNYPSFEFYQEVKDYPANPFERSNSWFNTHILLEGTANHSAQVSTLNLKKGGCQGWRFDETQDGIDLSGYKTIKVSFVRNPAKKTILKIYDNSGNANYFGDYCKVDIAGSKEFTIDLHNMISVEGKKIDPAHIRIVGFSSLGADQTIYLKSIELSGEEADAISFISDGNASIEAVYSVGGNKTNGLKKGMNIVKYSDGTTKKIIVK